MSDASAYHKGPPPIGSCWANTQETRVVVHTYGTHAHAYQVQYEVWRGFPELRRCGSATCNGTAWLSWLRFARRTSHPSDGGRDLVHQEPDAKGAGSTPSTMERRPTVALDDSVVEPKQPSSLLRRAYERSRVVHLEAKQQGKKDRDR